MKKNDKSKNYPKKRVVKSIYLTPDLIQKVENAALEDNRSFSAFVVNVLDMWMDTPRVS